MSIACKLQNDPARYLRGVGLRGTKGGLKRFLSNKTPRGAIRKEEFASNDHERKARGVGLGGGESMDRSWTGLNLHLATFAYI